MFPFEVTNYFIKYLARKSFSELRYGKKRIRKREKNHDKKNLFLFFSKFIELLSGENVHYFE